MKHLIDIEQFRALSRPVSRHVDESEVNAFIDECERIYIIPTIGYSLYKSLINYVGTFDKTFDDTFYFDTVLNGGEYNSANPRSCSCKSNKGKVKYCDGIRKALAYFVYGKILKNDGAIVARSGFFKHEDSHANHIETKENIRLYNDIMNMAEEFLKTTLAYIKVCKGIPKAGKRARYIAIGD